MIERTVLSLNQIADVWFAWMASMSVQIAILVLVLAGVTWTLKHRSARLKYAIWMLVPLRLVLPPTLALATGWGWWLLPEQTPTIAKHAETASSSTIEQIGASEFLARGAGIDAGPESNYGNGFVANDLLDADVSSAAATPAVALPGIQEEPSNEKVRLSLHAYMMLIWGTFVSGFLVRLGLGAIRVARTIRKSESAPDDVVQLASHCKKQMGLSQIVAIKCSRDLQSPMLIGIVKPTILLPVGVENLLSHNELRSVLVHELQHVARRDLIVNFVESLLAAIYFFHPGVWLARNVSRRLREEACDEGTVAVLDGQRREYGLGIVKVAELLTGQRQLSALSLLESKSQMKRRVMRILDPKLRAGRRLSWTAIFAVIALGAILIPGAARPRPWPSQPILASESDQTSVEPHTIKPYFTNQLLEPDIGSAQEPTTGQEFPNSIRIKVTGQDKKPLPGAKIHAYIVSLCPPVQRQENHICDDSGELDIELSSQPSEVKLYASLQGYVTAIEEWDQVTSGQLPKEFAFQLQTGTQIGGVVIDPQGKPIVGARVNVFLTLEDTKPVDGAPKKVARSIAAGEEEPNPAPITDEAGRWSLNSVPPGDDLKLKFMVTHPDFFTEKTLQSADECKTTLQELRQSAAKFTMNPGVRPERTIRKAESGRKLPENNEPTENRAPGQVIEPDSSLIETNAASPSPLRDQKESNSVSGQEQATAQETPKSIRFKVTDLNGKPLSGAGIYLNSSTSIPKPQVENEYVLCDELGVVNCELIPNTKGVRVWANHSGFVSLFASWEEETFSQLPKEFVFRLQPGTQIGGVILDPQGKPVSGVKVEVRCSGGTKLDGNTETHFTGSLAHGTGDPDPAIFSDSEGRWSLTNVPEGAVELSFLIAHPDFLTSTRFQSAGEYKTTVDELRQLKSEFKLREGVRANGRVVDPDGKPIRGAVIIWGDRPYWEEGSQEITSSDDGLFQLPAQPEGKKNITVVAKGWMPEIRNVDFQPNMQPVDFQLKPGKKLHLKFVDSDGKPVPNVYVQIQTWRGIESLYNIRHPNIVDAQIPSQANEQGEFIWDWAPDDEVKYMLGKPTTKYIAQSLVANGNIKTFTIDPKTTLNGNVLDAQTGKPITNFSVVPIAFGPSGRGIAQSGELKTFTTSQFSLDERSAHDPRDFEFQFDALGYRTTRSERFSISTMPSSIVIRMDPAPIQSGRVVNVDGKPVPGIHVHLATPEFGIMMDSAKFGRRDGHFFVTDDNGVFQYPAQVTSSALVVAESQGYAEKYVALDEAPGDLVLKPWAKVEGKLFQAGQPVSGARVVLMPIRPLGGKYPHVQAMFMETTDGNGQFAFKDVPPIPCTVSSTLTSWEDYSITSSQHVALDLQPGEMRSVKLGGDGISVTGKVKLLGEGADAIQFRYGINYLVHMAPGIKLPPSLGKVNFDWKSGRIEDWLSSTEGYAYLATLDHHIVKLNPDGSFFINGVAPGDYQFLLQIYEPPTGCLVDPVARKLVEFSVDTMSVDAGTLDLGNVELNISPVPKVGDIFPTFSLQKLDGKHRRFDEHRGKYVILDFWATWCAPCVQTMPKMAELKKSLGENSNVAVLSVSLDQELATAKAFVDEQRLDWEHGFIGDVESLAVRQLLGIGSVPLYYLVDPEGRIVLRSYDFDEFKKQLPTEFGIE